jgi:hypothetical protein
MSLGFIERFSHIPKLLTTFNYNTFLMNINSQCWVLSTTKNCITPVKTVDNFLLLVLYLVVVLFVEVEFDELVLVDGVVVVLLVVVVVVELWLQTICADSLAGTMNITI